MAEENELTNLKSKLKEAQQKQAETLQAAGTRTLENKQVEVLTIGPRAPAATILGLVSTRAARRHTVAEPDPTDPVVLFDTGPNDPVIIISV
jgi:hypothetical protein